MIKMIIPAVLYFLLSFSAIMAQEKTLYPDIPRIDVHCHIGENDTTIANYLDLRDRMKAKHGVEFAMWVNLGNHDKQIPDIDLIKKLSKNRMAVAINDYSSHNGLEIPPDDLSKLLEKGYTGYKIWAGPWYRRLKEDEKGYRYIDDPAHEPTFTKMEEIGLIGASIHIADPNGPWNNREKWLKDPVEYWREISAWRHVLERHPKLVAVMAHSNWLVCQDAQLDYLRNMLDTFPNLYLDLAATFQYFPLVMRGNLREFMIEWQDRIMFATDIGGWSGDEETEDHIRRYWNAFRILETDGLVEGSFFGDEAVEGLNLPREVLEKIYYKNAVRVYPHMQEAMEKLGYKVK